MAMVEIKPFEINYQEEVITMILDIQQGEFNIPITREQQPDLAQIDDFYRKGGGNFWLALHQGEVIGSIALIHIGNRTGVIRKMFVKKEFRGKEKGVAKLLLDTLLTYSRNMELSDIYLGTVQPLVAAIRFYEKNGFERIDKSDLPPTFPLIPIDTVFCHLKINNQDKI
ncbi:acetyltransferase (GNAT) family protein [Dyadobacter jejuensis]|uniref:Acetyltransferase (GNAT) family protein n=1 Tax=Dyadobacter jejuensis TaxID=1082580 RepID=A0A316AIC6_9BACT|nr:GNAT family N-acetyltransferase [Dyadobacter jejuensis]PWJ57456.1 acetyltransferase (GNAT) family protein [Dyadobacter jejuensis]